VGRGDEPPEQEPCHGLPRTPEAAAALAFGARASAMKGARCRRADTHSRLRNAKHCSGARRSGRHPATNMTLNGERPARPAVSDNGERRADDARSRRLRHCATLVSARVPNVLPETVAHTDVRRRAPGMGFPACLGKDVRARARDETDAPNVRPSRPTRPMFRPRIPMRPTSRHRHRFDRVREPFRNPKNIRQKDAGRTPPTATETFST
jgi:hypothetical protein